MLRKIANEITGFLELILACVFGVVTLFFAIVAIGLLALLAILYAEIFRDLIPLI